MQLLKIKHIQSTAKTNPRPAKLYSCLLYRLLQS